MKRVISLYGIANSGKTNTLRRLIAMLAAEAGQEADLDKHYDCRATFIVSGKTVCICTSGDDEYAINLATKYFEQNNFDIAVAACRTKGKPVKRLQDFAKKHSTHVEWWQSPNTNGWPNDLRSEIQDTTARFLRSEIDK